MLQLLFFLLLATINPSSSRHQCTIPSAVRAGYWLSNSDHYSPLSDINSSLYTHLYYYSLSVDETAFTVALPPQDRLPLLTDFSAAQKSRNPTIKTLLSIATDDHRTDASNTAFTTMAGNPNLRSAFISSTIELAAAHGFDGLDLAWQFPSSPSDMANFAVLLAEWRSHIRNLSSPLLITATVYFSVHMFDVPTDNIDYPISAISENLDWINVLCFGYHKNSDLTAADAAIYDKTTHLSTSYGIGSWLDAGISPCKLVMGIPLYGRSWYLKNKEKNGLDAQVVAAGPREKLSNQTGVMAYFEIKELLKENNSAFVYDNQSVTSYFHVGRLWVSFDSLEVLEEKIKFSLRNQLVGYFVFPISYDDSNYTVSRQAAELWQRYNASGEGKFGYKEAPSPEEMNPKDRAPQQSTDSSGSKRRSPATIHASYLLSCILLFLLLYPTKI